MEIKVNAQVKTGSYVITQDGIRMSYEEYFDMVKSEQN